MHISSVESTVSMRFGQQNHQAEILTVITSYDVVTSYQTTFVAVKSILRTLLFRSDSRNEDHQEDQQVRRRSGSPNRCIQRKVCGGGVFQRPGHVHGAVLVIPVGNEPITDGSGQSTSHPIDCHLLTTP